MLRIWVRGLRPPGPVAAPLVPRYALLPAPSPRVRAEPRRVAGTPLCGCCANPVVVVATDISACTRCGCRIGPSSGGRGGKECAASLRAEQRLAPGGGAPCPGPVKPGKRANPGGGQWCSRSRNTHLCPTHL